jgi:hypothetical protein
MMIAVQATLLHLNSLNDHPRHQLCQEILSQRELFLGKAGIDIACALAVYSFNNGASSLATSATRLELDPSSLSIKEKRVQEDQGK